MSSLVVNSVYLEPTQKQPVTAKKKKWEAITLRIVV